MAEAQDPRNPEATRLAAALRYREGMAAPVLVAKGRGLVADEIVRRAADHGVTIHVSNNLAAMLMQVEIDRAIPPQLFHAVAQLLAWLYRLERLAAATVTDPHHDPEAAAP
jgi:flagellar biosynthesis protein